MKSKIQLTPKGAEQLKKLRATLATVSDYLQKRDAAEQRIAELEKQTGAAALDANPRSVESIARAITDRMLSERALVGARAEVAELSLALAKESARMQRELAALLSANQAAANSVSAKQLDGYVDAEFLPRVTQWTRLAITANRQQLPSMVSTAEPADKALHPSETAEKVLDSIARLQSAIADAEATAATIAREAATV